jgi:small-conductance mechanosensitive channel
MKNLWMGLIKPKGIYAKWLLLLNMIGVMWLWSQGHFDAAEQYLSAEKFTVSLGKYDVTAYLALKALFSVIVIIWITAILAEFVDKRISSLSHVNIANRALFQKIAQILIYLIAFLFTLNFLGIDLTSLAVLGGAVGIGLGFGMQKIAANFISGMILLAEKSIKPGDLLELEDGTFGYVRKSSSRATLIETIDGREVLVPNEEFIVKQVINWTLNNNKARITLEFGVSYNSDLEKVKELALKAVNEHPKCMQTPETVCWLDSFGDSSVNFIIYFWVSNVNDGYRSVKSEALFKIWHTFKENGIEIPFPQRDLNFKGVPNLKISMEKEDAA